jgi:SAM-dependent methyltransferase
MKNILTAFLILLQRTDIQKYFLSGKFRSIYAKFSILSTLVILANSFRYKKIFELYYESIKKESELICNLVTDNFKTKTKIIILDIGCGIAGYHSKLLNLKSKSIQLYLMDNSEFNLKALRYGFGDSNRYYNSLYLAKNFLNKNSYSTLDSIF